MNRSAALLCLLLLARTLPVAAQTEIHHCIGTNGGAVFTDQPCAALHATPVQPSEKPADNGVVIPAAPPPVLCAATLSELRRSVIDAFASHNANRMAGLMLWNGYGNRTAVADIRSLNALMRQPLLDVEAPGDPANEGSVGSPGPDAPPTAVAPDADELVLHMAGTDASGSPRELRYSVMRRSGCLWLRNAD